MRRFLACAGTQRAVVELRVSLMVPVFLIQRVKTPVLPGSIDPQFTVVRFCVKLLSAKTVTLMPATKPDAFTGVVVVRSAVAAAATPASNPMMRTVPMVMLLFKVAPKRRMLQKKKEGESLCG